MTSYREYNFDGIVGPTHHFGGLSWGNLASTRHAGQVGNPRAAALEGLEKMRFVASLGVGQAVLPPQPRPPLGLLDRLGYGGDVGVALARAFNDSPEHVSRWFSASAMWTANAATVFPSSDAADGRLHLLVANLSAMPHRSLEPPDTYRVLARVFDDRNHFVVHQALPAYLGDEGAANQLTLRTHSAAVQLLTWGKRFDDPTSSAKFAARQAREASQAVLRLGQVPSTRGLLWQQSPFGIDAGAFHTDVLAVSHRHVLLLHEDAFVDPDGLLRELERRLGSEFRYCLATNSELSVHDAVASYPFNSQLVTVADGSLALIAPSEAHSSDPARRFLERAQEEIVELQHVHYVQVNSSMKNGGGPACLRLRVMLTEAERAAIGARVFFDDALYEELKAWICKYYRTELRLDDFRDPALIEETYGALDELTQLLELGSVYRFQRSAGA